MDTPSKPVFAAGKRALKWKLAACLVCCLLSLVVAEMVVRFVHPVGHPYPELQGNPEGAHLPANRYVPSFHEQTARVYRPDPAILHGLSEEVHFTINRFGFRSPRTSSINKPPGTTRIFAVGGSTTECLYNDDAEAWPEVLQSRLESRFGALDVINAGHSGDMTRDHLALVAQRIIPFEPDFVILLVGINELGLQLPDDYSPIRMDRRSAVRSQHPASLRFLLQARCADWSHLARMAIWSWRRATYTGESASPIQDERGTWIAERRRLRAAMPTKPIDASGLPSPEYAQNLRSLIGIARANGCEPVLVTQPALWGAPPGDWEQLLWVTVYGADFTASPDQLWEMLESFNDVTRTVAAEEQVLVIDLARLLPKSTEFFYDDDHFTVAGSQQVADIIAEALQRELDARSTRPEPGPK